MADFSPLRAVLSGNIILKSDDTKVYQEEIDATWNAAIRARKPSAFVKVASVEDVACSIKFCVQNKVIYVNLDLWLTCYMMALNHAGRI